MYNTLYYLALVTILASAGLSCATLYRRGSDLSPHLKLFGRLLAFTALVEGGVFLGYTLQMLDNSLQVYNIAHLIYFMTYAIYFTWLIRLRAIRRLLRGFLYLYPIFWLVVVFFIFKWDEWNSYVFVVGALFTIIWSLAYCYELFVSEETFVFTCHSEFWIALGLLSFYLCNLPYMGMFNFLSKNYANMLHVLQHLLLVFNILMYSLFSYAFICQLTNTKRS